MKKDGSASVSMFSHHSTSLHCRGTVVCSKTDGGDEEQQSDASGVHKVLKKKNGGGQ